MSDPTTIVNPGEYLGDPIDVFCVDDFPAVATERAEMVFIRLYDEHIATRFFRIDGGERPKRCD